MKRGILCLGVAFCLLLAGCHSAQVGGSAGPSEALSVAAGQESVVASPQPESEGAENPGLDQAQSGASSLEGAEPSPAPAGESATQETPAPDGRENSETAGNEEEKTMLQMKIGSTAVAVDWEENESVEALKALCQNGPLTIQMSMYGGFEQVGPLGESLPRNDSQTTTQAGDIVLYAGDQIVVFYGSNSWAYTRLGHIADQSPQGMAELLGNGDVTVTIQPAP